jgi:hypothetical protein
MSDPTDYVLVGALKAIYAINTQDSVSHSLTLNRLRSAFQTQFKIELDDSVAAFLIRKMGSAGVVSVIVDPYAETLIEVSDKAISSYCGENENEIIRRGWTNIGWLMSAYNNERLWQDVSNIVAGAAAVEAIPSADGFVTINHNSAAYVEAEASIVEADEALRGDNEFEDGEQRSWIRVHIETGLALLKRGGPVLRAAIISLIVEPLKAALKATTNENVKKLVGLALSALLKWLGL